MPRLADVPFTGARVRATCTAQLDRRHARPVTATGKSCRGRRLAPYGRHKGSTHLGGFLKTGVSIDSGRSGFEPRVGAKEVRQVRKLPAAVHLSLSEQERALVEQSLGFRCDTDAPRRRSGSRTVPVTIHLNFSEAASWLIDGGRNSVKYGLLHIEVTLHLRDGEIDVTREMLGGELDFEGEHKRIESGNEERGSVLEVGAGKVWSAKPASDVRGKASRSKKSSEAVQTERTEKNFKASVIPNPPHCAVWTIRSTSRNHCLDGRKVATLCHARRAPTKRLVQWREVRIAASDVKLIDYSLNSFSLDKFKSDIARRLMRRMIESSIAKHLMEHNCGTEAQARREDEVEREAGP